MCTAACRKCWFWAAAQQPITVKRKVMSNRAVQPYLDEGGGRNVKDSHTPIGKTHCQLIVAWVIGSACGNLSCMSQTSRAKRCEEPLAVGRVLLY